MLVSYRKISDQKMEVQYWRKDSLKGCLYNSVKFCVKLPTNNFNLFNV
jgi:hypothetical protein